MNPVPHQQPDRIRNYFKEKPEKHNDTFWYVAVAVFALLLLQGVLKPDATGLPLSLAGAAGLYIVSKQFRRIWRHRRLVSKEAAQRATDAEMDAALAAAHQRVTDRALSRLGVDEDDILAAPLFLGGPNPYAHITTGDDDRLRFTRHDLTLLLLTAHHVAVYTCQYDLVAHSITDDRTREFAFRDITHLETRMSTTVIYMEAGRKRLNGLQTLRLSTSGGDVIEVDYLYPDNAESAIRAIRKLLQEYKGM